MSTLEMISRTILNVGTVNIGVPQGQKTLVRGGPNTMISGGENGVLYVDAPRIEAVGVCVKGGRNGGDNEDSIGVAQNSSGSLLFHVADGMGGHDSGEIASSKLVTTMGELFRGSVTQFSDLHFIANRKLLDEQQRKELPESAGSTYAGVCVDVDRFPNGYIGTAGDSQVTLIDGGKDVFTTTPHSQACALWELLSKNHPLGDVFFQDPLVLEWLNSVRLHPQEKILASAGLLFKYMFRNAVVNNWMPRAEEDAFIDQTETALKSGLMCCLYTDGVGDMFTPYDMAKILGGNSPLYRKALRFARVVHASQEKGRKIDVGIGKRVQIGIKKDNFSFWLIRVK